MNKFIDILLAVSAGVLVTSADPTPPGRERPTGPLCSPFADGLTTQEEATATGCDTEAPLEELIPHRLRLRPGMSQMRARIAHPALRHDGEGSRPGRPMLSMLVPDRDGGGDIGVVFEDGKLASLFYGWSSEYAFTAANPGAVRANLSNALVRLGAPTVRRILSVPKGHRHYWTWTKGDHALIFEIERRSNARDEVRPYIYFERNRWGDGGVWDVAVGMAPDWDRAERIVYDFIDAPIQNPRNVRVELSREGVDYAVTDNHGATFRTIHFDLDFDAVRKALRDARVRWFGRERGIPPPVGGREEFLEVHGDGGILAKGRAEALAETWASGYPRPMKIHEILDTVLPLCIGELRLSTLPKNE